MRDERPEWAVDEVSAQLLALGVLPGGVLLVHTSFRAVRPIAGGPAGLVEGLRRALGTSGTLVMPSWTGDDDTAFDPAVTPCAADLGVVADVFWRTPGVARSGHPFAFAAAGPLAASIVGGPLPIPPHGPASPVGRVHDLDGQVLLLGVGHDASTTLHLAEVLAAVPYGVPRHCTVMVDGKTVRMDYRENDHCCEPFALVDGGLARGRPSGWWGPRRRGCYRARDAVAVAVERLAPGGSARVPASERLGVRGMRAGAGVDRVNRPPSNFRQRGDPQGRLRRRDEAERSRCTEL